MKHLFNDISSEEKNRIMEMHKKASDNLYLNEQPTVQPPRYTGRPMAGMSSGNPTLQTAIDALNSLETDSTMFMPYFNDMMNALLASKNGNDIKNLKIAIDAISKLSDTDRKALINSKLGVNEQSTVQPPRFTSRPMAGMSSSNPKLQQAINYLNRLQTDSTTFKPYLNDMMNALLASKSGGDIENLKRFIDAISKLSDADRKALINSKLGVDL